MPLPNGILTHIFIAGWFGVHSDDIALGKDRIVLSDFGESFNPYTTPTFLRRLFLSSSHPKPDSLMSLSLLPRTSGHWPVLFGRFLPSDLCLTLSGQPLIVSPRSKSKFLASYLPSDGRIGIKGLNGLTTRENLEEHLGAMIACAAPGT